MIIRCKSYPRVGLVGNPSDGYFGKTISFAFGNFCAEVIIYESPELEILPSEKDQSLFDSIESLVHDVVLHGYYGGVRLLKATIKRFFDYCGENRIDLHDKNFTIRYNSNIPHGVGLAGSSAIITACLRGLMGFYGVSIAKHVQANIVLSAEVDELNIAAGLQDRVIQAYEGLVYMDFSKEIMDKQGYGRYEPIDYRLLPPLYVAYHDDLSEPTEVFHNNLRERFSHGDRDVVGAMRYWANLTDKVKRALVNGESGKVGGLLDSNFDRRRKLCSLSENHIKMVEVARSAGASAKFTGSGGAIVGTYENAKMFSDLKKRLGLHGVRVIKPRIVSDSLG